MPAAKETGRKEMLKTKDNSNGKRNRFIVTTCGNLFSVIPYHEGISLPRRIFESNTFMKESESAGGQFPAARWG
jgi:hypothetical protein